MGEADTYFAFAESLHANGWIDDAIALGERALQLYEKIESPLARYPRESSGQMAACAKPQS